MSIKELANLVGIPYTTVLHQMQRGWCAWPRRTISGQTKDSAYKCWENMLSRCNNTNSTGYENYGGRGIKLHSEWLDFKKFIEHVGPRPSSKHSIDRIDVNGNYEPGNVRWASPLQQASNRRDTGIQKHRNRYRFELNYVRYSCRTLEEAELKRKELLENLK